MNISNFDLSVDADTKVRMCEEIAKELLQQIRDAKAEEKVLSTLVEGIVNLVIIDQATKLALDDSERVKNLSAVIELLGRIVGMQIVGVVPRDQVYN